MSIEKNNNISNSLDSKKMLQKLIEDMVKDFEIDKIKAEELVKIDSKNNREKLNSEIWKINNSRENKISNEKIEELVVKIKWYQETIENISKVEISDLKEDVEKTINIDDFKRNLEEYLPKELINSAKNPKNPHEQILWIALWTANSIFTTTEALYKIWKWLINTPYHLYLIFTWKATTDSFKNI